MYTVADCIPRGVNKKSNYRYVVAYLYYQIFIVSALVFKCNTLITYMFVRITRTTPFLYYKLRILLGHSKTQ